MTLCCVVDTTLPALSVGVADLSGPAKGDSFLWARVEPGRAGSGRLSPLVHEGLRHVGAVPRDVQGMAVSVGPGSFTGIKIGLAFAAGWVAGTSGSGRILGLSALEAAARFLAGQEGGPVALFLPATKTHGFVTVTQPALGDAAESMNTTLFDTTDSATVHGFVQGFPRNGTCAVVGPWNRLHKRLDAEDGRSVRSLDPAGVCRKALDMMVAQARGEWPTGFSAEPPEPRYLRLSTAEEKRRRAAHAESGT